MDKGLFKRDEFCAYYIELSKKRNKQAILYKVLETSLRLMHPFVPFITEEIYSLLNQKTPCITAPYPEAEGWRDLAVEEAFQKEIDLVHALRAIRAELQIPLGQAIDVYVSKLPSHPSILQSLVKIRSLHEGHCEGGNSDCS